MSWSLFFNQKKQSMYVQSNIAMSLKELTTTNIAIAAEAIKQINAITLDSKIKKNEWREPTWIQMTDSSVSGMVVSAAGHMNQLIDLRRYLHTLASQMEYSSEELHVLINRSSTYIDETMIALSDIKLICIRFSKKITSQIQFTVSTIVRNIYIYKEDENTTDLIDKSSIDSLLVMGDLEVAYKILRASVSKQMISEETKSYALTEIQKKEVELLGIKQSTSFSVSNTNMNNRLQRFGLVPSEGRCVPLKNIISNLFSIDMDTSIASLNDHLAVVSNKMNKKIGMVIIHTPNDPIYFDIGSLLLPGSAAEIKKETGISKKYISLFNTLQIEPSNGKSTDGEDEIFCFGFEESDVESVDVYVLWSFDLEKYRYKAEPIQSATIKKLLRNEPSDLIAKYNSSLEESLHVQRNDDIEYEYKKVGYYSFLDIPSETEMLDAMGRDIKDYLMKGLTEVDSVLAFVSKVNTNKFTSDICAITKKHKPVKKDTRIAMSVLDAVYLTDTINIVKKLKKELIDISNKMIGSTKKQYMDTLPDVIEYAVKPNSNIYNKFMSAYYLTKLHL